MFFYYEENLNADNAISVVDLESKEEVCKLNVVRLKGDRDFVKEDAYSKLFVSLGESIASL